jgi:hypothetical protein
MADAPLGLFACPGDNRFVAGRTGGRSSPEAILQEESVIMATVVKVIELVGTSTESWQAAAEEAIREASASLRHITGVDVVKHTAHVEDGEIKEYRTTMNVAFVVEHHSHLAGAGAQAVGAR